MFKAPEKPLLIVMTGHTYPHIQERFGGDFDAWMIKPMEALFGCLPLTKTVEVSRGAPLPDPNCLTDHYSGIIITGSASMVTDQSPWIVSTEDWIRHIVKAKHNLPILGICFGHQILASALGGQVNYHPKGREIGTHRVRKLPTAASDPLFADIPPSFLAHLTHLQSVIKLPEGATHLARNDFEGNQAFRFGQSIWGLQFHPEFTTDIMNAYILELSGALKKEAFDIPQLQAGIRSTPAGHTIMCAFAKQLI